MVLTEDTSRNGFAMIMEELGLEPGTVLESKGETDPYVANWLHPKRIVHVQYVEEPRLGVRYVLFTCGDLAWFGRKLGARITWDGIDKLYDDAETATTHDEGVDAIFRLTAGICTARNLPARAAHIFSEYLAQEHWMTRRAAVQAVTYGGWPESLEILEKVATEDSDERVREFANRQIPDVKKHLESRQNDRQ